MDRAPRWRNGTSPDKGGGSVGYKTPLHSGDRQGLALVLGAWVCQVVRVISIIEDDWSLPTRRSCPTHSRCACPRGCPRRWCGPPGRQPSTPPDHAHPWPPQKHRDGAAKRPSAAPSSPLPAPSGSDELDVWCGHHMNSNLPPLGVMDKPHRPVPCATSDDIRNVGCVAHRRLHRNRAQNLVS